MAIWGVIVIEFCCDDGAVEDPRLNRGSNDGFSISGDLIASLLAFMKLNDDAAGAGADVTFSFLRR
jgi:hypothetical protein